MLEFLLRYILFISAGLALLCQGQFPGQTPCSFRSPHGCIGDSCDYTASWVYNAPTDLVTFEVEISDPRNDKWISIGFGEKRFMPLSDVILGWVQKQFFSDSVHLTDRHNQGYVEPAVDLKQDVQLLSWNSTNGRSKLTFLRSRYTSDVHDVNLTSSQPCRFFFFPTDPGSFNQRGFITAHVTKPVVYGPVCISSCEITDYALTTGHCFNGKIMTDFSAAEIALQECKLRCDLVQDCAAFSYQADGSVCQILEKSCLPHERQAIRDGYTYEKLDIDNYNRRSGDCSGPTIRALSGIMTLLTCAATCSSNPICQAFSYDTRTSVCIPKYAMCTVMRPVYGMYTYYKLGNCQVVK